MSYFYEHLQYVLLLFLAPACLFLVLVYEKNLQSTKYFFGTSARLQT